MVATFMSNVWGVLKKTFFPPGGGGGGGGIVVLASFSFQGQKSSIRDLIYLTALLTLLLHVYQQIDGQ